MRLTDAVDLVVAPMIPGAYGRLSADWPNAVLEGPFPAEVRPARAEIAASTSGPVEWLDCYVGPEVNLSEDRLTQPGRAVRIRWRGHDHDMSTPVVTFTALARDHHQRVQVRRAG